MKTYAVFTPDPEDAIERVRKEFPTAPLINLCFFLPNEDLLYVIEDEGPERLSEIVLLGIV